MTSFYAWKNFSCAYQVYNQENSKDGKFPLLLIHPIGVGLSKVFWHRFIENWLTKYPHDTIYNPDLLGCGESDKPFAAYFSQDWGEQLAYFIEKIIQKPVIIVIQGALCAVAFSLIQQKSNLVKGLVLATPPAWQTMTETGKYWQQKLIWNLFFASGLGSLFYKYARRRQFLESFSTKQLFAKPESVDDEWLDNLEKDAVNLDTRHAVFSFLAGFWREDYRDRIEGIYQPTLVVIGEEASSISRSGVSETPEERLSLYLQHLPNATGKKIPGRNILPYESTPEFVEIVANFCHNLSNSLS